MSSVNAESHHTYRSTSSQFINAIKEEMREGGDTTAVPYHPTNTHTQEQRDTSRAILMELIDALGYVEVAIKQLSAPERSLFRLHLLIAMQQHSAKCALRGLDPLVHTYQALSDVMSKEPLS